MKTDNKLIKIIFYWLPLAVVITALSLTIYVVVQQDLRLGANDLPIQLAEDTAAALSGGDTIASLLEDKKIDLASSLAPFIIIFNEQEMPIASTVELDGQIPIPPPGVFAFTKAHGQNRLTWQPQTGIRNATVTVHFSGKESGYVLAGQSLRQVEKRIGLLGLQVLAAWLASLFFSLIVITSLV